MTESIVTTGQQKFPLAAETKKKKLRNELHSTLVSKFMIFTIPTQHDQSFS